MLGHVRRFFRKITGKHIEVIAPGATDICKIEVETTDKMLRRSSSRERRRHKTLPAKRSFRYRYE